MCDVLSALMAYSMYKVVAEIGYRIVDYTHKQYLASLENYLKRLRLLYETGQISEEEYRKREAQVRGIIKSLKNQMRERLERGVVDIRI